MTMSGQTFENVYDVAWSGERQPDPVTGKVPSVGSTVDVSKATYTNKPDRPTGAESLSLCPQSF
jgi:hypothetical protein